MNKLGAQTQKQESLTCLNTDRCTSMKSWTKFIEFWIILKQNVLSNPHSLFRRRRDKLFVERTTLLNLYDWIWFVFPFYMQHHRNETCFKMFQICLPIFVATHLWSTKTFWLSKQDGGAATTESQVLEREGLGLEPSWGCSFRRVSGLKETRENL